LLADFMGEHMADKSFWLNVFAGQTRGWVESVRRGVALALQAVSDKLRIRGARDAALGANAFLTADPKELREVRKALADAFNEWLKDGVEERIDPLTVDEAARNAAMHSANDRPEPTEAQREAGNYAKGHVTINGLNISIENPAGTHRRPEWPMLKGHYGYIKGTIGGDNEHMDVFIKPKTPNDYAGPVFVVDQTNKNGRFDEHKVMLGWPDAEAAREAYLANYTPGWNLGPMVEYPSMDAFKDWLKNGNTKGPAGTTLYSDRDRPSWEDEVEAELQAEMRNFDPNVDPNKLH
jgi:hypothetical protein